MPVAISRFETDKAARFLVQLCKHFAHKAEVEWSETQGVANLPGGKLELVADDQALSIRIVGEDIKGLTKARYILEDHLVRFAFREKLYCLHWVVTEDGSSEQ